MLEGPRLTSHTFYMPLLSGFQLCCHVLTRCFCLLQHICTLAFPRVWCVFMEQWRTLAVGWEETPVLLSVSFA